MRTLGIRLRSLAVFRALLDDSVIAALCAYLDSLGGDVAQAVSLYAKFVSCLYDTGAPTLADYVRDIVADDENADIRMVGRGQTPSEEMGEAVRQELKILQAVADLSPAALRQRLEWEGYLPAFRQGQMDLAAYYADRCANIMRYGYGIYARYRMFYIDTDGKIVPVRHPDRTRLVDYEREQKIILDNTVALLEGKPAANILLTGDAGTGKSSTVKAVVNELHHRGLRILEVRKEQLHQIPEVLDELNSNPLKFILFIDDLSFQKDDDDYSAMKAILEGSVSARSQTERFGIQITFQKPNKQTYLDIVRHLAQEHGIGYDPKTLELEAERFALGRGGRSARAAKQFVDGLIAARDG